MSRASVAIMLTSWNFGWNQFLLSRIGLCLASFMLTGFLKAPVRYENIILTLVQSQLIESVSSTERGGISDAIGAMCERGSKNANIIRKLTVEQQIYGGVF